MTLLLGIDTGGTFTDAVCMNEEGSILKTAKSETTRDDLCLGIQDVINIVLPKEVADVRLVSLSTTLATNAIVEGHGSSVCLLLFGYDRDCLELPEFKKIESSLSVEFLDGGHTLRGDEQAPLDINRLKDVIMSHASKVSAFGISGYFGVRNPSHELTAKKLVKELTGLPVTCGHELTSDLNAPLRAFTVALNARLISLMQESIAAVRNVMSRFNIDAPLMIVKGDGSLVHEDMALERPVETILSGPAASVIGATYLTDQADAFVIDMGGTTTDISAVQDRFPLLNSQGSRVGGYRTMVKAVDAQTRGLGGDSEITANERKDLIVGPRRAIPLCLMTDKHPEAIDALSFQMKLNGADSAAGNGRFFMQKSANAIEQTNLTRKHLDILATLSDRPLSEYLLAQKEEHPFLFLKYVDDLIERGLVIVSAFTPTDAVNVLGLYENGSSKASHLGASLWADKLDISPEAFCRNVLSHVERQLAHEIVSHALYNEGVADEYHKDPRNPILIDRALSQEKNSNMSVSVSMNRPLVAIGAPVGTYFPPVADMLNGRLLIPEHAPVASAVGAVAGGILQTVRILIKPLMGRSLHRVHLPDGIKDFDTYPPAVVYAERIAREVAKQHAVRAGAKAVEITLEKHVNALPHDDAQEEGEIYIDTEITATAVGRPDLGGPPER